MKKIIAGLEDDVQKAWKLHTIVSETVGLPSKEILSDKVVSKLQKYRPIELTLEYPVTKEPLVPTDLRQYKVYFI